MACSQTDTEKEPVEQAASRVSENPEASAQVEATVVRSGEPTVRTADSHVHGGAVLSIVSEKDTIFVELETPLHNILGFEYAPQTPAEKAKVVQVEARFAQPQTLIRFNDQANCIYNDVKNPKVLFEPHSSEEEGRGEHDHDHDDDHDHNEELDKHDDDKDLTDHKDIVLRYSLTCTKLDKLKSVQVEIFKYFPNFTELDLVYLGQSQQMSAELSPSRPKVDLTQ